MQDIQHPHNDKNDPPHRLIGQRVRIKGESAWNGETGTVMGFIPKNGALIVDVTSGLSVAFFESELEPLGCKG